MALRLRPNFEIVEILMMKPSSSSPQSLRLWMEISSSDRSVCDSLLHAMGVKISHRYENRLNYISTPGMFKLYVYDCLRRLREKLMHTL